MVNKKSKAEMPKKDNKGNTGKDNTGENNSGYGNSGNEQAIP